MQIKFSGNNRTNRQVTIKENIGKNVLKYKNTKTYIEWEQSLKQDWGQEGKKHTRFLNLVDFKSIVKLPAKKEQNTLKKSGFNFSSVVSEANSEQLFQAAKGMGLSPKVLYIVKT